MESDEDEWWSQIAFFKFSLLVNNWQQFQIGTGIWNIPSR